MRYIYLVNTEQVALVDDDDFELVKNSGPWYEHKGWAVQHGRRGGKTMHAFIFGSAQENIDHIDRNRLNNQKGNLRSCTIAQNRANRGKFKNNKTGYIGVIYHKRIHKYQAYIDKEGRRYNLGTYDDAVVAALARDRKAKELHGEFASLNFPQ